VKFHGEIYGAISTALDFSEAVKLHFVNLIQKYSPVASPAKRRALTIN